MAKSSTSAAPSAAHPNAARELVEWIRSLPSEIQLRLDGSGTTSFDRDVYQLHLPYLTAVIILHLRRSAHDLPQSLPPAILAASCTAKILKAILVRGNARFLMAITCWYCGTAFIALLQGSRIPQFAKDAEDGISVLISMVEQLQKMWPSANVIRQGFDRMRKDEPPNGATTEPPGLMSHPKQPDASAVVASAQQLQMVSLEEPDWTNLLPFATGSNDKIAECLIRNKESGNVTRGMPSPANMSFYNNVMNEYNDFLDPLLTDYQGDFSDFSLFQV